MPDLIGIWEIFRWEKKKDGINNLRGHSFTFLIKTTIRSSELSMHYQSLDDIEDQQSHLNFSIVTVSDQ